MEIKSYKRESKDYIHKFLCDNGWLWLVARGYCHPDYSEFRRVISQEKAYYKQLRTMADKKEWIWNPLKWKCKKIVYNLDNFDSLHVRHWFFYKYYKLEKIV